MRTWEVPATEAVLFAVAATARAAVEATAARVVIDHAALMAADLLLAPDEELRELLTTMRVDVTALSDALRDAARDHEALHNWHLQMPCRHGQIWVRDGRYVFVPLRKSERLPSQEVPTQAIIRPVDFADAELTAEIIAVSEAYGIEEDDTRDPYWKAFGDRAREGFQRRARYVGAWTDDALVRLMATEHVSRGRFDFIGERQICAPRDDPARVARALAIAVNASRG